jgi:hypothetical protein
LPILEYTKHTNAIEKLIYFEENLKKIFIKSLRAAKAGTFIEINDMVEDNTKRNTSSFMFVVG